MIKSKLLKLHHVMVHLVCQQPVSFSATDIGVSSYFWKTRGGFGGHEGCSGKILLHLARIFLTRGVMNLWAVLST